MFVWGRSIIKLNMISPLSWLWIVLELWAESNKTYYFSRHAFGVCVVVGVWVFKSQELLFYFLIYIIGKTAAPEFRVVWHCVHHKQVCRFIYRKYNFEQKGELICSLWWICFSSYLNPCHLIFTVPYNEWSIDSSTESSILCSQWAKIQKTLPFKNSSTWTGCSLWMNRTPLYIGQYYERLSMFKCHLDSCLSEVYISPLLILIFFLIPSKW